MRRKPQKIGVTLSAQEYQLMSSEAARLGLPLAAYVREAAKQFVKIRDEHAAFLAAAGKGDDAAAAKSVVQILLTKLEERVANSIDRQSREVQKLRSEVSVLQAFQDRFAYLYLLHTPELARETVLGAKAAADRRYSRLLSNVEDRLEGAPLVMAKSAAVTLAAASAPDDDDDLVTEMLAEAESVEEVDDGPADE
jgi:rubrerythrin